MATTTPRSAVRLGPGTLDPHQRHNRLPGHPAWLRWGGRPLPVVGTARVYVCGITPYDVTHLGHAATFVWADVLAATLGTTGAEVSTCRNVTDIDDVLTAAALARGRYYDELALTQQAVFDQSMRVLRVATPSHEPRARHHVHAVQQLAQALLDVDAAYERDGTVWFRGASVPQEAGIDRETALQLARDYGDDPDSPAKDDPFDIALWRAAAPDDDTHPAWPSPWGWGRPGWHAECAAMATTAHGSAVDVLVGGEDLRFPHHAYQSAMAEAATGVTPFSRATMHVGEVRIDGEKMAKSTGNLVLVDDVLASCSPVALRMLLLDRPHDVAWDFSHADLAGAEQRLEALYSAAGKTISAGESGSGAGPDPAIARLLDGLDVSGAIDVAIADGGEVARALIALLRLG